MSKSNEKKSVLVVSPALHAEFKRWCEEEGRKLGRAAELALQDYMRRQREADARSAEAET